MEYSSGREKDIFSLLLYGLQAPDGRNYPLPLKTGAVFKK
jgi:hypothetical protein